MAETVWLIDDCPLTIRIVKARLKSLGARAYAMPSGQAALGAWHSGALPSPGVILIDPSIPGISGLAASKMLRDSGFLGMLLLHTGSESGPALVDQPSSVFDGVLIKPVSRDGFASMLESAAAHRAKRAA